MTEFALMIYAVASFAIVFCYLRKHRGDFIDEDDFAIIAFVAFMFCFMAAPIFVLLHTLWFLAEFVGYCGKLIVMLFDWVDELISREK